MNLRVSQEHGFPKDKQKERQMQGKTIKRNIPTSASASITGCTSKEPGTGKDIVQAIETVMTGTRTPMTQLSIRNVLNNFSKQQINSTLYKTTDVFQQHPGTPPTWSLIPKAVENEEAFESSEEKEIDYKNETYVFIDLGNIHNLSDPLKDYTECVTVIGFADLHYNGKEPENTVRATVQMANAADVLLAKSFNEIYSKTRGKSSYIICSKDSFFCSYPWVYENTKIITVWDQLKLEL